MSSSDLKNRYTKLPGYLSISSVLAGAAAIDCRILQTIPRHGWMNPTSSGGDLSPNMELKLPLWMVHEMSFKKAIPTGAACYWSEMQFIMEECGKEDCYDIDLSRLSPHFYESLILHIFSILEKRDITGEMMEELTHFFHMRSQWVARSVLFPASDPGAQTAHLKDGLEWEHELYKNSFNILIKWASYLRVFAPGSSGSTESSESTMQPQLQESSGSPQLEKLAEVKQENADNDAEQEPEEELSAPPFSPLGPGSSED